MYSKRRIAVITKTIVYTMKRGWNGNGHLRIAPSLNSFSMLAGFHP
jgi:hypothetical protein